MESLKSKLIMLKTMGCTGIKISFEDEGALLNEMITMRYLTASVGLELSIKIGGCEAKRDISDAIDLCCDAIVAPMIESNFSMKKFIDSLSSSQYVGRKGFNLETIHAYNNVIDILDLNECNFLTFGRVDFVTSLNKDRSYVDSPEMFEIVKDTFTKTKERNMKCYLGGSITTNSYDFINKLTSIGLLDKFETRYIIFDTSKIKFENFNDTIYMANAFEIEWLKFINARYTNAANKDIDRIRMMEKRASR